MSREVAVHHLIGKIVRDADGRKIGRIEELRAEIVLRDQGNEYVVTEFHVGSFGALEALVGSRLARLLLRRLGPLSRYRFRCVGWEQMDLSDPSRPRTRVSADALPTED